MIRSLSRALLSLVALVGLAGTAHAAYVPATWTDNYDPGPLGSVVIDPQHSYPYFHDLTLDGFQVGSDFVTDFLLTIDLYNDNKREIFDVAVVDLPGVIGDRIVSAFSFGNDAYAGWSIAGLIELNLLGTLSVTITSWNGDFYFGGSQLVAHGYTNVPEPSTIALLGIGLLGIAIGARRRKATQV